MVINLTIVNTFVLHTLHLNITHSTRITRKTTKKKEKFEMCGEIGKEPK